MELIYIILILALLTFTYRKLFPTLEAKFNKGILNGFTFSGVEHKTKIHFKEKVVLMINVYNNSGLQKGIKYTYDHNTRLGYIGDKQFRIFIYSNEINDYYLEYNEALYKIDMELSNI